MIKRLLKYSLISFIVSVGTYIIISKHTTEESILIGRPVDVIFILPSLQSSSYEYTNDNHIDTTRESDSMTFEVEDVFSEDIYMMEIEDSEDDNMIETEEFSSTYSTDAKAAEKTIDGKKEINFELTFYTSLDCENGYGAITSTGEPLADKMLLASNVYDIGTQIYIENYGVLEVEDRGGSEMDIANRLDIYLPRQQGESDAEYKNRALQYGRQTAKGYIIN